MADRDSQSHILVWNCSQTLLEEKPKESNIEKNFSDRARRRVRSSSRVTSYCRYLNNFLTLSSLLEVFFFTDKCFASLFSKKIFFAEDFMVDLLMIRGLITWKIIASRSDPYDRLAPSFYCYVAPIVHWPFQPVLNGWVPPIRKPFHLIWLIFSPWKSSKN